VYCSLTFILGALLAVEYLASLSRITLIFSKSFKAMILGSTFQVAPNRGKGTKLGEGERDLARGGGKGLS
jgi:hypothetical protein